MNRKITRLAFAAVATPALLLTAPAMAFADVEFGHSEEFAGPKGAYAKSIYSSVDEDGNVSFGQSEKFAGKYGAGSMSTYSSTDADD